jgi:hypothetical protein
MPEGLIERITREAGVPDLVDVLAERLSPRDLHSLLLEVYLRVAATISPDALLEQYERDRFVAPSPADPRLIAEVDRLAWSLLPEGYVPLELSPLCPLGTNSVVASVSQNRVVSTIRRTEVVADSTNVLALECASRRRRLLQQPDRRREPVLLAASHRLTRAQRFDGPRMWAHFRILSLCAAGRDEGSFRFESDQLVAQIGFHIRLLQALATLGLIFDRVRVAVTDITDGRLTETLEAQIVAPLSQRFPHVSVHFDPERVSGRGYYDRVCFKLFAADRGGQEIELGDGGPTTWTRNLLSDHKERLVISGLGAERLYAAGL